MPPFINKEKGNPYELDRPRSDYIMLIFSEGMVLKFKTHKAKPPSSKNTFR